MFEVEVCVKIPSPRLPQNPDPRLAQIPDPRLPQIPDPRLLLGFPRSQILGNYGHVLCPRSSVTGSCLRYGHVLCPRSPQIPDPRLPQIPDPRLLQIPDPR